MGGVPCPWFTLSKIILSAVRACRFYLCDHPAPVQAEGLPAKRATVPVIGKRLSDSQQGGGASPKGSKPRKSAEGTVTIKQSQWDTLMDKIDKMDKSVPQVTV